MRTLFSTIILLLGFVLVCLNAENVRAQTCPTGGSCDRDNDGYLRDNPKCKKDFPSCTMIDCDDGDAAVQECSSGGDATGPGYYARLDLCEDPFPSCDSHIVSDGGSGVAPDGTPYDYWDSNDSEMTGTPSPNVKCDLSSGGRLKFEHPIGPGVGDVDRWISIHWEPTECPAAEHMTPTLLPNECPGLYTRLYEDADPSQKLPPETLDPCVDNLHFNISADRLFKPGATRQEFEIYFDKDRFSEERTRYTLFWYDYLYIYQPDENSAVLTTWDGSEHHSKAKLVDVGESAGKKDDILLACFDVKFTVSAVKGPAGYN